jgi:8-oxo-dGTP pyrophosphatase MutT (NUDIX family)
MLRIRQAGAIAYRRSKGECRFLLITSRRRPNAWIFPKGHVERGETSDACAERELLEESGVSGAIEAPLGSLMAKRYGKKVEIEYFLVRQQRRGTAQEGRRRDWLPYSEARDQLAYKGARRMLDRAARRLGLL